MRRTNIGNGTGRTFTRKDPGGWKLARLKRSIKRVVRKKKSIIYMKEHRTTPNKNGTRNKWFSFFVILDNELVNLWYDPAMKKSRADGNLYWVDQQGAWEIFRHIEELIKYEFMDKVFLVRIT